MTVDFGYCLWLTSKNSIDLVTNNFKPHITILKNLTLEDCECVKQLISQHKKYSFHVKLSEQPVCFKDEPDGFNGIYYTVSILDFDGEINIPDWWPDNAHVSLCYKYNEDISDKELQDVKDSITNTVFYFDTLEIYKCIGHHNDWKKIS